MSGWDAICLRLMSLAMQVVYASQGSDIPSSSIKLICIEEPPRVRWCTSSHKVFPAAFRAASGSFLLCHHRTPPMLPDHSDARWAPSLDSSCCTC